jgi:hypothetical protein
MISGGEGGFPDQESWATVKRRIPPIARAITCWLQLQEFLQDLNARMSAAKVAGFWSDTDKKRWINKAVIRACNFAKWNFLTHHATQTTEANVEAYFIPFDYKPGGMMFIKVDGGEYVKTKIENYQSGDYVWEKVFAFVGDQFLLTPIPSEDDKVIDIYYRRRPIPLVNDTDEPITPEEMDEPVIKLSLATCLQKDPNRRADGDKEILEANALLQQIKDREDEEGGEAGYAGQATSTRFLYKNSNHQDQ